MQRERAKERETCLCMRFVLSVNESVRVQEPHTKTPIFIKRRRPLRALNVPIDMNGRAVAVSNILLPQ